MMDDEIDLSSLILIVVVVVCSYGLALILSLTCWNAYRQVAVLYLNVHSSWTPNIRRHRESDLYCPSCCGLQPPHPSGYVQMMPPKYTGLPQYR